MRREVVKRIETVVKDLWPAADVGVSLFAPLPVGWVTGWCAALVCNSFSDAQGLVEVLGCS